MKQKRNHQYWMGRIYNAATNMVLRNEDIPDYLVEYLTSSHEQVSQLAFDREFAFFFACLLKNIKNKQMANLYVRKIEFPMELQKTVISRLQQGNTNEFKAYTEMAPFADELHEPLWTVLAKKPELLHGYIANYPLTESVFFKFWKMFPNMRKRYLCHNELSVKLLRYIWLKYETECSKENPDKKFLGYLEKYAVLYVTFHELPAEVARMIWIFIQKRKSSEKATWDKYVEFYLSKHPLPAGIVEATFAQSGEIIDAALASLEVKSLVTWAAKPFASEDEVVLIEHCQSADFQYYLRKFGGKLGIEAQKSLWRKGREKKLKIYIDMVGNFSPEVEPLIYTVDISKWPEHRKMAIYYRDNSAVPVDNVEAFFRL